MKKTIVLMLCLLMLPLAPLRAAVLTQMTEKTALKYDIYAGGFKAMDASIQMDLSEKAYDMALSAKTQGMIGTLFPWQGNYSTSGILNAKAEFLPLQHMSMSNWRSNIKTMELDYSPAGHLMKILTQRGGETKVNRDIKRADADGAVDLLTGTLLMMRQAKGAEHCQGNFPVYDGSRRYNITLQDDGHEEIKKTKFSVFSGNALRCTLKVEPVAGFSKKDQKRGWMAVQNHTEARHKLPTIWFAQLLPDSPAVPVRMEIASEYGSVVAHLAKTENK